MTTRFKPEPMPPEFGRMMAFWTRLVELRKPRGRCRGCALRSGTAANRCGSTAGKVAHTLLWGGGFRCHHVNGNGLVTTESKLANRPCRGFDALLDALGARFTTAKEMTSEAPGNGGPR